MLEMDRHVISRRTSSDLLITDVGKKMPSGNGLVIVGALRDAGWDLPVIAMTAFSDASVRTEANRVGATLLAKPFRMEVAPASSVRGFRGWESGRELPGVGLNRPRRPLRPSSSS